MPGLSVLHCLPQFAQTYIHWVSNAIQLSHPLLLPSSPALNLYQHQGLFQWVDSSHQVTKHWSFSICFSKEYSGLISFRIDWFDFLAVQETLSSLLQHHNLKASVLRCSAFFMDFCQLLSLLVSTEMSLLFDTLSRFVITFLPRSNHLLISWLQSPSAVILEPKKRKFATAFTFSPSILPWRDGTKCHDLSFFNVEF